MDGFGGEVELCASAGTTSVIQAHKQSSLAPLSDQTQGLTGPELNPNQLTISGHFALDFMFVHSTGQGLFQLPVVKKNLGAFSRS